MVDHVLILNLFSQSFLKFVIIFWELLLRLSSFVLSYYCMHSHMYFLKIGIINYVIEKYFVINKLWYISFTCAVVTMMKFVL